MNWSWFCLLFWAVTAVPDGLKAWEILRGRPHNIDLILTEVDLPSISGFALLTLIMEHEICKNIPVISMICTYHWLIFYLRLFINFKFCAYCFHYAVMSSQDSVSTVYKCMLRGAADYLVKPLRRNELRNLWQHVWRRQSVCVLFYGSLSHISFIIVLFPSESYFISIFH